MAGIGDWFNRLRGADTNPQAGYGANAPRSEDTNAYFDIVGQMQSQATKGLNNQDVAYIDPPEGDMSFSYVEGDGFINRPALTSTNDITAILKRYSSNAILTSIINTRANQVLAFAKRAILSDSGVGFQVRLRSSDDPTPDQQKTINRVESYLENMGVDYNPQRDNFPMFLRKLVRDTYTYDQVNYENTYDRKGKLSHTRIVDPTTIFFAKDKDGRRKTTGKLFVQVVDHKVVRSFTAREMAMFIRNPRTDMYSMGYGLSELEVGLREFMAHDSTEIFNDRFFSHGGTTRGVFVINPGSNQSQTSRRALDDFKRAWTASSSGMNGSWRIPVMTVEDAKFVNMTPQAQDMQFEKWLNYLINIISALYAIDPAEIGFTNRGGATGSKSNSLNEGNSQSKVDESKSKGLAPLLDLIARSITDNIVRHLAGDNYIFEFTGNDINTQKAKLSVLEQELKNYKTVNEARQERGLPKINGGDTILSAVYIQRLGQIEQVKMNDNSTKSQRLSLLEQDLQAPEEPQQVPSGVSFQDKQAGFNGKTSKASGKGNEKGVGKDGQAKDKTNANSFGQGGK